MEQKIRDEVIPLAVAAERIGITRSTLRQYFREKRIPNFYTESGTAGLTESTIASIKEHRAKYGQSWLFHFPRSGEFISQEPGAITFLENASESEEMKRKFSELPDEKKSVFWAMVHRARMLAKSGRHTAGLEMIDSTLLEFSI